MTGVAEATFLTIVYVRRQGLCLAKLQQWLCLLGSLAMAWAPLPALFLVLPLSSDQQGLPALRRSQSVACVFTLWTGSSTEQICLILVMFSLSVFFFFYDGSCFYVMSRNSSPSPCPKGFLLCFLLWILEFLFFFFLFTFSLVIFFFFELFFCIRCEAWWSFRFLPMDIHLFEYHLLKRLSFLHSFVKNPLAVVCGTVSGLSVLLQ